jgi:uncharacterized protein YjdB
MPYKHKLSRRLAINRVTVLVAAVLTVGCEDQPLTPYGNIAGITVRPRDVSLEPGESQTFQAYTITLPGDTLDVPNIDVDWTTSGGAITPNGVFTAAEDDGEYVVTATSRRKEKVKDSARVRVRARLTALVITPSSATLSPGASQRFMAYGRRRGDSVAVDVSYAASGGDISPDGVYTAGPRTGTFEVIAVENLPPSTSSSAGPGRQPMTDTATVLLVPSSSLDRVVLTPPSVHLTPGESQQFASYGQLTNGDSISIDVTYSATGGTVTVDGLFTAGADTGTYSITATDTAGILADTSAIVVSEDPPVLLEIILEPSSVALYTGEVRQFTALGRFDSGDTLEISATYSAQGGTISSDGLYTAAQVAGDYLVVARDASDLLADSATVTVLEVPVASVSVSPDAASILETETVQLTATARDSANNVLVGRPIGWSSSDTVTAVVASDGTVTGRFEGVAWVTAISGGVSDSAEITVTANTPAPVASVEVTPGSANLTVGGSVQLTALPRDSAGAPLPDRPVTWSSADQSIATVVATGMVMAVAPGSVTITAAVEGVQGNAAIEVLDDSGSGLAFLAHRRDGGAGSVLVSSGIPLPPGALRESELDRVRVFVEGVEQAIHVEALACAWGRRARQATSQV